MRVTLQLILFLSLLISHAWGDHHLKINREQLKPATSEELIDASLKLQKHSLEMVEEKKKEPCPETSDAPEGIKRPDLKAKKNAEKTFVCTCEIGTKEELSPLDNILIDRESFVERYIGKNRLSQFKLTTGNDNWGHGLGRVMGLDHESWFEGDDRGRTFSAEGSWRWAGEEGEFDLSIGTIGWGKLSPRITPGKNGGSDQYDWTNDEGEYYQDFLEKDIVDISYLNFVDGGGKGNTVRFGLRFEDYKDHGSGAQGIQEWFHGIDEDYIQYDYQDWLKDYQGDEFKDRIVGYFGLGHRWEADLGKWKCGASAEALLGLDFLDPEYVEYGGRVSFDVNSGTSGGRTADNPWFAVSLYDQAMANTVDEGIDHSIGLMLSTSFKAGKNVRIQPFMGIEFHDAFEDRFFETGDEIYHTVGIMVTVGGGN